MSRDRSPSMRIDDALVEACMNIEHGAPVFETICSNSAIAVTEYLPLELTD